MKFWSFSWDLVVQLCLRVCCPFLEVLRKLPMKSPISGFLERQLLRELPSVYFFRRGVARLMKLRDPSPPSESMRSNSKNVHDVRGILGLTPGIWMVTLGVPAKSFPQSPTHFRPGKGVADLLLGPADFKFYPEPRWGAVVRTVWDFFEHVSSCLDQATLDLQ